MNNKIREILDELYQIDNSLINHEKDLIKVIWKMIESKPDTEFSDKFKNELKQKIIKQLNFTKPQKTSIFENIHRSLILIFSWAAIASFFIIAIFPQITWTNNWWNLAYNDLSKKAWSSKWESNLLKNNITITKSGSDNQITTLEKVVDWTWIISNSWLITSPILSNSKNVVKNNTKNTIKESSLAYVKINKVSDNAFWSFNITSQPAWWNSDLMGVSDYSSSDMVSRANPTITSNETISPKVLNEDTSLMQYEEIKYTYSYTWIIDWLDTPTMELLKKINPKPISNSTLMSNLQNLKLWWFSLNEIRDSNLAYFNIKENKDYWLEFQINIEESKIFVTKNLDKWPNTQTKNSEQIKNSQITISDFPSDSRIISLSNEVIKKYNIDLKNYSYPIVNNDWKVDYLKSENRDNYFFPDTIQVIYPLLLNGKKVYEDYGSIKWLKVSFDVKTLNLSEISWLEWLVFESSNYPIENNINNINDMIMKWGKNTHSTSYGSNSKINNVIIHLNKPKLVYVVINDYKDGKTIEYYVPSLVFESIEKPKAWEYFQEKVVIPLIKDLFDSSK